MSQLSLAMELVEKMFIQRALIKNYRCLEDADVTFNARLNVIVGHNECGKSTLLEAIDLALTCQLNSRPLAIELHPYLFNQKVVDTYVKALKAGTRAAPPFIDIELYLHDDPALSKLKGINNTLNLDLPGISLRIELNPVYAAEFEQYVADPAEIVTLPIEFYHYIWRDFADNPIVNARTVPLKSSLIDASTIRNNAAANRYVIDIIKESLSRKEKVDLALTYRQMKDKFLEEPKVRSINDALAKTKGTISDKAVTVSLDTSARANWETGIMPHLDHIPLTLVGKGEQNSVKIKLALQSSETSHLVLIEEAENHLSYAALNELIGHIASHAGERQILITTHSSFVLNKLGVEALLLFIRGRSFRLTDLQDPTTTRYFMKLPGHDTLRLILSKRSILVEGPSDELIVQRAYAKKHGKMPLQDGVDVIAVNALAFTRFLEIARVLKRETDVITDNDGDVAALKRKYADYDGVSGIIIRYDDDEAAKTLEPQLLKKNGLSRVNKVLGKNFADDAAALKHMLANKAETALKFFETDELWDAPDYIIEALR